MAEVRIENMLKHVASMNRVKVRYISGKFGIAVGYCLTRRTETYITYSPAMGAKSWYPHTGNCDDCSERPNCEKELSQLAIDWKVSIREGMSPTELGKYLFDTVMRRLGWESKPDPD